MSEVTKETHDEDALLLQKKERALVWKIDRLLMPLLTISFGLQYYDKAVLGSASVFGIIADLHLSTTTHGVTSTIRYSTANAAFYYGYICAVLGWALLLQRFPLVKTLSVLIFIWGLICLLTIVCTNYQGLVVQRVFLGIVESAVSPGFVTITGMWYKREEAALRLGIWYAATGIFSMFSGALNYGLGSAKGPLHNWKYMYIFAGSATMAWAFAVYFFVPASPEKPGRFFTEEDKVILRRRSEAIGTKAETPLNWNQAKEAALDIKIWILAIMGAAIYVSNGAVTAFGSRIVSTFGYTSLQAIAYQIPGGAFTCVSLWIFGWIAGKWKDSRTYLIPLSCIPVIIGSIIIWKGSWVHPGLPLFGYYLLPTFGTPYVLVLALGAANFAGGTKRAVVNGAIFIGYNIGNIVGAYTVLTPEAKIHYRSTWIIVISMMCFTSVASILLRFLFIQENKKKEAQAIASTPAVATPLDEKAEDVESGSEQNVDLTDKQLPSFRYSL